MKIHILTVGEPKLSYAKAGWQEYLGRLKHYHTVRTTHISDKHAYDADYILGACAHNYRVALAIEGKQFDSPSLSEFLEKRSMDGRELCFIIGGPEGLPKAVLEAADSLWSLSALTFPHDLAMVILAEALYRASTISAGQPYHK